MAPAVRKGSAGVAASLGSTGKVYTVPDALRAVKSPAFLPLYRLWCRYWSTVSTFRTRPCTLRMCKTSVKESSRHGTTRCAPSLPLGPLLPLCPLLPLGPRLPQCPLLPLCPCVPLVATGATVSTERGLRRRWVLFLC